MLWSGCDCTHVRDEEIIQTWFTLSVLPDGVRGWEEVVWGALPSNSSATNGSWWASPFRHLCKWCIAWDKAHPTEMDEVPSQGIIGPHIVPIDVMYLVYGADYNKNWTKFVTWIASNISTIWFIKGTFELTLKCSWAEGGGGREFFHLFQSSGKASFLVKCTQMSQYLVSWLPLDCFQIIFSSRWHSLKFIALKLLE